MITVNSASKLAETIINSNVFMVNNGMDKKIIHIRFELNSDGVSVEIDYSRPEINRGMDYWQLLDYITDTNLIDKINTAIIDFWNNQDV